MSAYDRNLNLPVVQVADTQVQQIAYKGEPVVTFAMVDDIHQRPDGTASRNFREHRERFVEGADFVKISADEIRRHKIMSISPKAYGDVVFLTERGYLKLVKPMQDDRAWEVQGEMIDCYFKAKAAQIAKPASGIRIDKAREIRLTMDRALRFAKLVGLEGSAAAVSANSTTKALTGFDYLNAMGITHLPSETGERMVRPTEIGKAFDVSAIRANAMLIEFGYQTADRDHRGAKIYRLTEKGSATGARFEDTQKRHSNGAMVQQLLWPDSIIRRLADDQEAAML